MKEKAAAAAAPAVKRRESGGAGGRRPRKRARDGNVEGDPPSHGDLISRLTDDILGTIISLLPTKDGARTQILARRWRPLWRSSPLNLEANYGLCPNEFKLLPLVSKILSKHPGPARRFRFYIRLHKAKKRFAEEAAQIESWFRSPALDGLQDLDISFSLLDYTDEKRYPLPPSVFLCASTLVVARMSFCDFPKEIPPSLSFPFLKQLTLECLSISRDIFHAVLSSCDVLESLYLEEIHGDVGCLCISSPTLRALGLCACFPGTGEIVIEDAPLLERLLLPCPEEGRETIETIRVVRAPSLQILGPLSPHISEIKIASLHFKVAAGQQQPFAIASCMQRCHVYNIFSYVHCFIQSLTPASLKNTITTVKILALDFSVPDLNAVIDVLRCFPCLETLYVTVSTHLLLKCHIVRLILFQNAYLRI
jgi:hypothetical protein